MPEQWRYQVNGFELGPVPAVEVARLLRKGRVAPDTPVRPEGGGEWSTAERLAGPTEEVVPPEVEAPEVEAPAAGARASAPWHLLLLDRFAPVGLPLGVALMLPRDRPAIAAGALILSVFAGALAKALAGMARDLGAPRRGGPG